MPRELRMLFCMVMSNRLRISSGGQVSVPAAVRARWQTSTVIAEDHGDRLILRPAPDDPIAAARGALKDRAIGPSELIRAEERELERQAEQRRHAG